MYPEQGREHLGIEGDDTVHRPPGRAGVGSSSLRTDLGKVRRHRQLGERRVTSVPTDVGDAELSVLGQQLDVLEHGAAERARLDRTGEQDEVADRLVGTEQSRSHLDRIEGVLQLWQVGGDALPEVGDLVLAPVRPTTANQTARRLRGDP